MAQVNGAKVCLPNPLSKKLKLSRYRYNDKQQVCWHLCPLGYFSVIRRYFTGIKSTNCDQEAVSAQLESTP